MADVLFGPTIFHVLSYTTSLASLVKYRLLLPIFFMHTSKKASDKLDIPMLVSKYGGERDSFYKPIRTLQQELTTENYRKRVTTILFKSKFFENRANDVERLLAQKTQKRIFIRTDWNQSNYYYKQKM
jgi:hypothetical protein